MEPDVIRMYSSSPPPLEDGVAEDEEDEFGDFGTFSGVSGSLSLTEFETPTSFDQNQALTSPPELLSRLSKANGLVSPVLLDRTDVRKVSPEVLTNGFVQGSPSSPSSVHSPIKATSSEDTGSVPVCSPQDDFADFAAFSSAEGQVSPPADQDQDCPSGTGWPGPAHQDQQGRTEDDVRDTNMSASESLCVPAEALDRDCQQRDDVSAEDAETVCTNEPLPLPGVGGAKGDESKDATGCGEHELSADAAAAGDSEAGHSDETETETETSLGRPLSTDALEEYGDMSTTGSVPSPPLQGDTATPADHSQMAEDEEDEDFGDFGDVGGQGFADFEQSRSQDEDDFGDFNSPRDLGCGQGGGASGGGAVTDFPVSDSFGNFSSAVGGANGTEEAGWSAFGEQPAEGEESWAVFSSEPSPAPPVESRGGREGQEEEGAEQQEEEQQEEEEGEGLKAEHPAVRDETMRTDGQAVRTLDRK